MINFKFTQFSHKCKQQLVEDQNVFENLETAAGAVPMHELLAHGFAEVAQEALYDVGPFVPESDGTNGSPAAGDVELHDDRCFGPPYVLCRWVFNVLPHMRSARAASWRCATLLTVLSYEDARLFIEACVQC